MRNTKTIGFSLLGLLAVGLVATMWLGYIFPLRALAPGLDAPDAKFSGYDRATIEALRQAYVQTPAAGDILRAMHLGPDLLLPLVLALLLGGAMLVLMPGQMFYNRLLSRKHAVYACLLPLGFMIADYAENIVSLMYFPPATPDQAQIDQLAGLMPWLTSLKFMFLMISALVTARFVSNHVLAATKNRQNPTPPA